MHWYASRRHNNTTVTRQCCYLFNGRSFTLYRHWHGIASPRIASHHITITTVVVCIGRWWNSDRKPGDLIYSICNACNRPILNKNYELFNILVVRSCAHRNMSLSCYFVSFSPATEWAGWGFCVANKYPWRKYRVELGVDQRWCCCWTWRNGICWASLEIVALFVECLQVVSTSQWTRSNPLEFKMKLNRCQFVCIRNKETVLHAPIRDDVLSLCVFIHEITIPFVSSNATRQHSPVCYHITICVVNDIQNYVQALWQW